MHLWGLTVGVPEQPGLCPLLVGVCIRPNGSNRRAPRGAPEAGARPSQSTDHVRLAVPGPSPGVCPPSVTVTHTRQPRDGGGGRGPACGAFPGLTVGRCGGRRFAVCQGHRSGTGSVDPWRLLPSQGRARTPARQKPPRKPRGCIWNSRPLGGSRENLSHDARVSATMGLRGGVTRGKGGRT